MQRFGRARVTYMRDTGKWRLLSRENFGGSSHWYTLCDYDFKEEACTQALRLVKGMRQVHDDCDGIITFDVLESMFLEGNGGHDLLRRMSDAYTYASQHHQEDQFAFVCHRSGLDAMFESLSQVYSSKPARDLERARA